MLTSIIIASLLFADPVPRVETVAGSLQFSVTRDGNGGDEVNQGVYDGNIKKFWSIGEETKHGY